MKATTKRAFIEQFITIRVLSESFVEASDDNEPCGVFVALARVTSKDFAFQTISLELFVLVSSQVFRVCYQIPTTVAFSSFVGDVKPRKRQLLFTIERFN